MKPIILHTDTISNEVVIFYPQLGEMDLVHQPTVIKCLSDEQYESVINNILLETKTEDILTKLENEIKDWYINNNYASATKAYQTEWFKIDIQIVGLYNRLVVTDLLSQIDHNIDIREETIKEMYDKAFEYFKIETHEIKILVVDASVELPNPALYFEKYHAVFVYENENQYMVVKNKLDDERGALTKDRLNNFAVHHKAVVEYQD